MICFYSSCVVPILFFFVCVCLLFRLSTFLPIALMSSGWLAFSQSLMFSLLFGQPRQELSFWSMQSQPSSEASSLTTWCLKRSWNCLAQENLEGGLLSYFTSYKLLNKNNLPFALTKQVKKSTYNGFKHGFIHVCRTALCFLWVHIDKLSLNHYLFVMVSVTHCFWIIYIFWQHWWLSAKWYWLIFKSEVCTSLSAGNLRFTMVKI